MLSCGVADIDILLSAEQKKSGREQQGAEEKEGRGLKKRRRAVVRRLFLIQGNRSIVTFINFRF